MQARTGDWPTGRRWPDTGTGQASSQQRHSLEHHVVVPSPLQRKVGVCRQAGRSVGSSAGNERPRGM